MGSIIAIRSDNSFLVVQTFPNRFSLGEDRFRSTDPGRFVNLFERIISGNQFFSLQRPVFVFRNPLAFRPVTRASALDRFGDLLVNFFEGLTCEGDRRQTHVPNMPIFRNFVEPQIEDQSTTQVNFSEGDRWTRAVENHNDEVHADAHARNVQHERSLAPNAGAKGYFDKAIEEYVTTIERPIQELESKIRTLLDQPSTEEIEQSLAKALDEHSKLFADFKEKIEDIENSMPSFYLALADEVVRRAVNSEKPLMLRGRPTEELPLALHSSGHDLENLRIQRKEGNTLESMREKINEIAYRIQNTLSYIEAVKQPIETYRNSIKFLSLKERFFSKT